MKTRYAAVAAALLCLLAGVLGLGALPAAAQGCAMCKLSAEAAGEEAARALDYGIFILMTPTVIIFLGIFYWAFTHRDAPLGDQLEEEEAAAAAPPPIGGDAPGGDTAA